MTVLEALFEALKRDGETPEVALSLAREAASIIGVNPVIKRGDETALIAELLRQMKQTKPMSMEAAKKGLAKRLSRN